MVFKQKKEDWQIVRDAALTCFPPTHPSRRFFARHIDGKSLTFWALRRHPAFDLLPDSHQEKAQSEAWGRIYSPVISTERMKIAAAQASEAIQWRYLLSGLLGRLLAKREFQKANEKINEIVRSFFFRYLKDNLVKLKPADTIF